MAEDPVIDGKLDDAAWAGIEALSFVMATKKDQPQPRFPTTVQAVWTRWGVTFGFRMSEPEPEKLMRDIGAATRATRDRATTRTPSADCRSLNSKKV